MPKTDQPDKSLDDIAPARGGRGPVLASGVLVGGKYRIERRLARGGQASVYLARQEPLERVVALKILSPPSHEATEEEREAFEQRFLLEARTLAGLDHPNIVTIFDYGETEDGRYYLAMEYVDGCRFLDLLKKGRLEPSRVINLAMQVCHALRYAHKRGVVHRDVKNSNVLVRRMDNGEEQVKVVDFGLVKLSRVDTTITQTGMILGSPHFMAPEQATGSGVDHRTDIYATGVLIYCGLIGKYPFDGPHATAIITAHVTRAPPRFKSVLPDVQFPAGMEDVVQRCLEKKPSKRYSSMDALVADLGSFYMGPEVEGISGEFHTLSARPAVRGRDWTTIGAGIVVGGIIAVALALVAATAVIGYRMTSGDEVKKPVAIQPQVRAPTPPAATDEQAASPPAVPEPEPEPSVAEPAVEATPVVQPRPRRRPRRTASPQAPAPSPTPSPPPASEPNTSDWGEQDDDDLRNPWTD